MRWDVLSNDAQQVIAECVPLWFALGDGEKPRASKRGKYLPEWVRANGGPPKRGDRLSPNVFTKRIARVEIGDADSAVPYSVVRRIIRWETGPSRQSVSKYTSQDARINIPDAWEGDRNPITYRSIQDAHIDFTKLEWEAMPEAANPLRPVDETLVSSASPKGAIRPLTMAEAKKGLALTFNVPPEAIEITIRG